MLQFKKKMLLLVALVAAMSGFAQRTTTFRGVVVSQQDGRPIELATVRLLQLPDSTLLTGATTDSLGRFFITAAAPSRVALKASFLGLPSVVKTLAVESRDTLDVGKLFMESDEITLRAAMVKATLARVEQKEDTTVFNAAAFRTPEGSTLEALIKQLPGAEVAQDGTVTVNGKTVKQFLVNGKDFFKGDNDVAMKNLPTNMVSKIKSYDKKSDYSEQTGVDDGEETFVLDISTKRELNESFVSNIDLAAGWDYKNKALYSGKVFATRFTDHSRYTFFSSRNNVGDKGFGGPRGFSEGNGGLTTATRVGFDFSWNNDKKEYSKGFFEMGGHAMYFRNDNNTESTNASETFLSSTAAKGSFSNSHSWANTLTQRIHSGLRFKWSPDSLTSISFRPMFSWSRSNTDRTSQTATFDDDPFERYDVADTDDVLSRAFRHSAQQGKIETDDDFLVNLNQRFALGESSSHSFDGRVDATRRLGGKAGRNVSLQARGSYERSNSFSYSKSDIYTRSTTELPSVAGNSVLIANGTHQFSDNNSKAWSYRVGGSYVEPIVGKLFAELRYNYEHKFTDSNRSLYNLYSLSGYNTLSDFLSHHTQYGSIANLYVPGSDELTTWSDPAQLLSTLSAADLQAAVRDDQNSQYATYTYDNHNAQLRLRFKTDKMNLSGGLSFTPERTRLEYERPLVGRIDTVRNVFNVSPQLRLRYNFSKTNRLDINYRGASSEPSMTNLLNVVDSSDPLNISVGNPGLKPAWNDNFRANYNGYDATSQRGIMANAYFNHTRNAISTMMVYDTNSGRQFTRPENISGNWSAGAGFNFNTPLDRDKIFTLSTGTNASFNRNVAYISTHLTNVATFETPTLAQLNELFAATKMEKNVNRSLALGESLDLAYRRSFWDVSLNGRANYQHAVSSLKSNNNLDTWSFSYGATANLNLDNGFSLSTDIRMQSRRGFSASAMNTNELLWNAQLSKSFLKSRALTVSLQFYDILQQQSNISRNITAMMRSDSWNNAIHAYAMLHVIYKLNVFGGNTKSITDDRDRPAPPDREQGERGKGWGGPPPGGGGNHGGPGPDF